MHLSIHVYIYLYIVEGRSWVNTIPQSSREWVQLARKNTKWGFRLQVRGWVGSQVKGMRWLPVWQDLKAHCEALSTVTWVFLKTLPFLCVLSTQKTFRSFYLSKLCWRCSATLCWCAGKIPALSLLSRLCLHASGRGRWYINTRPFISYVPLRTTHSSFKIRSFLI